MNIKTQVYLLIGTFFFISFVSCKKDNKITTPVLAEFVGSGSIGSYFIKDDPNSVFKIPVGITRVSNASRTVTFSVSSPTGAVEGQQYNLGVTSITIPPGTAVDSISLNGIFSGYPAGRIDTLVFTITGGDVSIFKGATTYKVVMQKYCEVVLSDLEGDYSAIDNGNYGPYPVQMLPGSEVSTGPTSGTIQIANLWDYGVPTTVTLQLDWSDPSHFGISIPDQEFVAADDIWIKGSASFGTFSSCAQTFELRYTLYEKTSGDDYAPDQVSVLTR